MTIRRVLPWLLAPAAVWAQARPEFEVASIRASAAQRPDQVNVGLRLDGAQVRIEYLSLKDYIGLAYRLRFYQISGPDWLASQRFDVTAKLPEGASPDKIPEMLQALLADRFQVKLHRESKELPIYGLEVARGGLKINELPPDANDDRAGRPVSVAAGGSGAGGGSGGVNLGNGSSFTFGNNRFEARKVNMVTLADSLTRFTDRPVIDMTGLKGNYDFAIEVTPEDYRAMLIRSAIAAGVVLPPEAMKALDVASGDSLSSGLQKLGLRLEARKAPLDVVVIDSASKTPTEN